MSDKIRRWLRPRVLVPLALLFLFFFGGWTLRNKLAADREGEWVRVTRGDLVTGVEVTGTLAAVQSESFGPPQIQFLWDYKVAMMAPEGTEVKAGQTVLGFDTSELQKRLDQSSAEAEQARKEIEKKRADLRLQTEDERLALAEAEARLRKASMNVDAAPALQGETAMKQAKLDFELARRETIAIKARLAAMERAAAAEIRLLQSKQHTAERQVNENQDAINRMSVKAPRAGTIVYVTNWRGDKKKVGDTAWRAEKVIEIPDLSKMTAKGEVDEVDAGRIAVGQRVTFRLDAHADEEFRGTIRKAERTVQQRQGTRDPLKVLRVEIDLDRTDAAKMRPGMRFKGTVELHRVKNALLIPREAVFVSDSGPIAYRRGLVDIETARLRLGRENEEKVEVQSGLSTSDRVLVKKSGDAQKEQS